MRIAESEHNTSAGPLFKLAKGQKPIGKSSAVPNTYATNFLDTLNTESDNTASETEGDVLEAVEDDSSANEEARKVLDRIAEALGRLGRVKRVGLGVSEKASFAEMWTKKRR